MSTDRGPSFCVLPWVHLHASVDGVWGRCCVDGSTHHDDQYSSDAPPADGLRADALGCAPKSRYAQHEPDRAMDLRAAFNSPNMRRTRLAMLAGEAVPACAYCYRREALGGRSYRQTAPAALAGRVDIDAAVAAMAADGSVDSFPPFLDLRFGNSCNLRCVMCGYPSSSRWGLDLHPSWAPAHLDPYRDDEDLWRVLADHADELRRLYVAGGEPLLQRGHTRLVDLLVGTGAAANIDLVYNTNLTVVPTWWLDALPLFRSVAIGASCDGVDDVYERIRTGARWSAFVANLRLVRPRATSVWLAVSPQRDNVLHLADIVEFAAAEAVGIDLSNVVHWPEDLALANLPDDVYRQAGPTLERLRQQCLERGMAGIAEQVASVARVAGVAD